MYACVFVVLHSHGVVSGELVIVMHTCVLADRALSTCPGLRAHLCEAGKRKWTGVPHFTKPKLTHCDVHYRSHLHSLVLLNLVCPTYFFIGVTGGARLLHFEEVDGPFVECQDPRGCLEGQC